MGVPSFFMSTKWAFHHKHQHSSATSYDSHGFPMAQIRIETLKIPEDSVASLRFPVETDCCLLPCTAQKSGGARRRPSRRFLESPWRKARRARACGNAAEARGVLLKFDLMILEKKSETKFAHFSFGLMLRIRMRFGVRIMMIFISKTLKHLLRKQTHELTQPR